MLYYREDMLICGLWFNAKKEEHFANGILKN